jgi:hypothetical protein
MQNKCWDNIGCALIGKNNAICIIFSSMLPPPRLGGCLHQNHYIVRFDLRRGNAILGLSTPVNS